MGQIPERDSWIVLGEKRCGEFCVRILVTRAMIEAAASRNCGDLADFEGQVADGLGRNGDRIAGVASW